MNDVRSNSCNSVPVPPWAWIHHVMAFTFGVSVVQVILARHFLNENLRMCHRKQQK